MRSQGALQAVDDKYELGTVGEFAQDIGGALGQMLPSMAVGVINPAAGVASFGVQAGLQGYGQARDEGASYEDAMRYGVATGVMEAGIEKATGGMGKVFGKGVLDKAIKMSPNTTKKAVLANTLKGAAGEGAEEAVSGFVDPYLKRATYDEDAENASASELAYQAAIGAALGGLLGGSSNALDYRSTKKATQKAEAEALKAQKASERAQREKALEEESNTFNEPEKYAKIKNEYENATDENLVQYAKDVLEQKSKESYRLKDVSPREASDIKNILGFDTTGFKTVIEPRVVKHIEKRHGENGQADKSMANLDDYGRIQYVLDNYDNVYYGGKSKAYKEPKVLDNGTTKSVSANTIVYEKRIDGFVYTIKAVPDAKAKTTYIDSVFITKTQKEDKSALFADAAEAPQRNVQNATMNNLSSTSTIPQQGEAVNAYAKAYEQMLSKDSAESQGKARELSEDEQKTKRFIKMAATNARLDVEYKDMPLSQKAYYKDGTVYINANRPLNEGMKSTVAHEIYHSLEGSKEHDKIVELALKHASDNAIQAKIDSYAKYGIKLDEEGAKAEIGAEYIEKALTDEATINEILLENKSLAGRIWERIKDLVRVYKAKKNMTAEEAEEYAALLKAKRLYEDGLAKLNSGEYEPYSGERNARYQAIKRTDDGRNYVEVEDDFLAGVPKKDWGKVAMQNLAEKFPNGVQIGNNLIKINAISRSELRGSDYSKYLYNNNSEAYYDKMSVTNNADELLQSNRDYVNEDLKHERKDNIKNFGRGKILFKVGDNTYSADMIVGNKADGSMVLYDIVNMQPEKFQEKKQPSKEPDLSSEVGATATTDSVSDFGRNVNSQSENFGRDERFSIDEDFVNNYDKWVADGRSGGKSIKVGRTSKALQSVGVRENQVRIDTSKINKIQQKHPAMSDDVIKKVPEILEKPIVIMESLGNQNSQNVYNNRLTLFGEVMDTDGKSVLAVLELEPTDKEGNVLNLTKIASTYGKNAQHLLDNSRVLYIEPNKKRTNDWLRLQGLQLPIGLTNKSGSIGRISYNNPVVKSENEKYAIDDTTDTTNRYDELIDQYGEMDKGMEPRVDRAVPKQTNDWDKVRKFTRTAMESENVSDEAKSRIEDELASDINSGKFVYEPVSNQKLQDKANRRIARNGYDGSKGAVFAKYRNNERIKAEDVAELEQLIVKASAEGRVDDVMDMVGLAAMVGTEMGQSIQAMSMLKRMTPEGKLKQMYLLRDRLNSKYELSGNEEVEVNKRLAKMLLNKENTAEDTEIIQEYIINDLAKQLPVGKKDKIDAWRYLAMLGNPRTHIRNTMGNILNLTVTRLNDQLAGVIEAIALKEGKRTKAAGVVSKDLKEFAQSDWENNGKYLTDLSSKYGERGQAEREKRVFKTKTLETLRKANENAMEAEDVFFKKRQYAYALSHYMKANKISKEVMQEENNPIAIKARQYAAEEALRVTFQEKNELANALNHFEHKESDSKLVKAGQLATKAMVPFKKTPLNILKRGVEYSPVGIAEGMGDIIHYFRKNGTVSGAEIVEEMSRGLTGSAIMILGYFLAENGWLSSGYDEENRREQTFENQIGGQNFALTVPGVGSYTLDWAAPAVMPLFAGAALYNDIVSRHDGEGIGLKDIGSAMIKITDPILEMSCMDGLQSALTSFSSEGLTSNIIISATESYLLQFVPTLSGQIARTIDDTKRSTYAPSDSKFTKTGESLGRQFRSKIPGASFKNEASVDVWGRERKQTGSNIATRAAFNMLSPGSAVKSTETATDRELKRLYEESGETGVLPKMGSKYISFKADGKHSKTYYLTAKEYTKYQKKYGQDNFKAVSELIRSNVYKSMSDEDKAKAVKEIYTYNGQMANKEFFEGRDIDYDNGASMTEKLKEAGGWVGYFENKQGFSEYNAQREANGKKALDYDDMVKYKEKCDKYGIDYTAYAESREKITELKDANTEKFKKLEEQGKKVKSSDKTEANKKAIAKYLASRKDLTDPQRQVIWKEYYKGKSSETYKSVARRYGF